MKLAEHSACRSSRFIDTPGAYPGIDAEERGQTEAIGQNLVVMARAAGADHRHRSSAKAARAARSRSASATHVLMLEYSIYSVISPEGCASILWKTREQGARGRRALGHHRASPEGARPDRQDRQRTARRRASRSEADGGLMLKRALTRCASSAHGRTTYAAPPGTRPTANSYDPSDECSRAASRCGADACPRADERRERTAARVDAVVVGYSGGRDSSALLHAMSEARASAAGLRAVAVPCPSWPEPDADAWLAHWIARTLRASASPSTVPRTSRKAVRPRARSGGPQAALRALARDGARRGVQLMLLRPSSHDQAETLLLQWLRGAGTAGLSALPAARALRRRAWCMRAACSTGPRAAIEALRRGARGWTSSTTTATTTTRFAAQSPAPRRDGRRWSRAFAMPRARFGRSRRSASRTPQRWSTRSPPSTSPRSPRRAASMLRPGAPVERATARQTCARAGCAHALGEAAAREPGSSELLDEALAPRRSVAGLPVPAKCAAIAAGCWWPRRRLHRPRGRAWWSTWPCGPP